MGLKFRGGGFNLFRPEVILIGAISGLTILGLVVLLSVTQASAFFVKQIIFLGIAVSAGGIFTFLNLETLRKGAWGVGIASGLGLLAVLLVGKEVKGAQRWIDLGLINIQVSEFAKLALIFVLAHYLATQQRCLKTFRKGFLIPTLIVVGTAGLITLQPDFGTAFLSGAVGFTMLFMAGVSLVYLIPMLLTGTACFAVAICLDPVRFERITAFLNLEAYKTDSAYQLYQSILAFGAGGVTGVGLGNGRQQIAFLPEAHTDFIFPIIGEELGIGFTVSVTVLFLAIFILGLSALRRAPNLFQFLLALGALLLITLQALLNIGVTTGCLPTKGLSLPFISYGGSNLVLMFTLAGILLNCFRSWARPAVIRPQEL